MCARAYRSKQWLLSLIAEDFVLLELAQKPVKNQPAEMASQIASANADITTIKDEDLLRKMVSELLKPIDKWTAIMCVG